MKRVWAVASIILLSLNLVFAIVDVEEVTNFKANYTSGEIISGNIDILINSEDINSLLTSNQGGNLTLQSFLDQNGETNYCTPNDCSNDYIASSATSSKTLSLGTNNKFVGFMLTGENIEITDLSFDLSSNFGTSNTLPLQINFFENEVWNYDEFSNEYGNQRWGCYNFFFAEQGPKIADSTAYCEMITLPKTNKMKVGAQVTNTDTKNIRMDVYPKEGIGSVGNCIFNGTTDDSCEISAAVGQVFEEAEYQVCVTGLESTEYRVFRETNGENCGFVQENGPEENTRDYSIFAQAAKYADATGISLDSDVFTSVVTHANDFIESKYGGDCSSGCIFPLNISGISQTLQINNIELDYKNSGEVDEDNKIYDLEIVPAQVDFDGVLDLSFTGFTANQSGDFIIRLGETKILDEEITLLSILESTNASGFSLHPLSPPAGVPITFTLIEDEDEAENENTTISSGNRRYEWDFGDGSTIKKTTVSKATHTFDTIQNYTITITLLEGFKNIGSKAFRITTISPAESVNLTLKEKNESLSNIKDSISSFPFWYRSVLTDQARISFYETELTNLARSRDAAKTAEDFVDIVEDLYAARFPQGLITSSKQGFKLATELQDIKPEIVQGITSGGSDETFGTDYKRSISTWQDTHILSDISTEVFILKHDDGQKQEVLRTYEITLTNTNKDEEAYLVIGVPIQDISFSGEAPPEAEGSSTIVTIGADSTKTLRFYYEASTTEAPLFVSPRLNALVLEEGIAIDDSCNFNNICEEGEDSNSCRQDCTPVFWTIFWIVAIILFTLIVYTILQVWYERNYENHLFGDRRHLYNLLMYIHNARAQGLTDSQIRSELKKNKWSGERITYAINRSRGKSNGMYALIPVNWFISKSHKRKAKDLNTTAPQQQLGGNINKSPFQRPVR